jgi:hypothetical protein
MILKQERTFWQNEPNRQAATLNCWPALNICRSQPALPSAATGRALRYTFVMSGEPLKLFAKRSQFGTTRPPAAADGETSLITENDLTIRRAFERQASSSSTPTAEVRASGCGKTRGKGSVFDPPGPRSSTRTEADRASGSASRGSRNQPNERLGGCGMHHPPLQPWHESCFD